MWGPPSGDILISVGERKRDLEKTFDDVREAARLPPNPWVMPYEDELPIYIARRPRVPVAEIWPRTRHYN